jgi:predicted transposase YbfD/YdcC
VRKKSSIQKVIAEFKEIAAHMDFQLDLESTPAKPIKRLLRLFSDINDDRDQPRTTYPLGEILLIAFIAIVAGADSFISIEDYCNTKLVLLKKFTPLKDGVPSHDTFRRVFMLLSPESLQHATVHFLLDNIKLMRRAFGIADEGLRHLCVDGKTANGTGRLPGTTAETPKIHTLHVYDNTYSTCLISREVGVKTNEIPVAQEVLKELNLKDVIVTFDAMHTQRKTIEIIAERKGRYLGALKGNQPEFMAEAKSYFTSARLRRIKEQDKEKNTIFLSYSEKAHNCIETRTYWLTKNVAWMTQLDEWPNLKAIVRYEKKTTHLVTAKETKEIRYFITSLTDVKDCADAIRGHWSVENLLHWHLDTTFREDDCTISDRKAFQNFSLMNKLALSLLKLAAPILKVSVKSTKRIAGWSTENVLRILCVFDEDVLKTAMLNVKSDAGKKGKLIMPEEY